jgi:hypothetical protein
MLEIFGSDCVSFCSALFRSRTALAAENLFLRKQLAVRSCRRFGSFFYALEIRMTASL